MDNKQLNDTISKRMGRSSADVAKLLDALVATIKERCGELDSIAIPGFGTFEARKRAARIGRNPQTGKELKIAATTVPAFSAGKKFKELVK